MLRSSWGHLPTNGETSVTMAFAGKDVLPEKRTGYFVDGKEIILSKTRGRPMTGKGILPLPDSKKLEVAGVYAVTGHIGRTSELTGIPEKTLRDWREKEWFQSLLLKIRKENDEVIDAKTTKIVDQALDAIVDRIENGDFVVLKTGEIIRKPVGVRDLALVSAITIDKRQLLRGLPTSRTESVSSDQQLAKLAENFTALANKGKPTPVIEDVEFQVVPKEDGQK